MTVLLDQFVRTLAESRLMPAERVQAFLDGLPADERPVSGEELAKLLVRGGKLTKFQAQAVYQGKTKGLVLGDYVVLDKIGQGGMGQVFKAEHRRMRRVVALKTLPAAATKSEQSIQRFQREVQVAARLAHPNIVTAHDAGESHGLHYLVMEFVDGSDLASVVRQRGQLPVDKALDYLIQAARGLEYAHLQKVIHRDIKPSNLLLDKEGNVKVLDMGLARLNEEIGSEDGTAQETLTGTGQVMGTIDFMPPEQAENTKTADERSDVYSLGCTLHFLLAGRAIYEGDTTVMKILAHREAEIPSLRAERGDVSKELDAVYQKMVAKKAADRYASMTEVRMELERCAAPSAAQLAETETFAGAPAKKGTGPICRNGPAGASHKLDQSPFSLDLDFPVVSPMDQFRRKHPKRAKLSRQHILVGSAAVAMFLVLLFGVVFMLRTPEGTLVVTVNQPDARISVDDGKLTLTAPGQEPVQIEVAEGRHTLKVTKGGFETFTDQFTVKSGDRKALDVKLLPKPVGQAVPDVGKIRENGMRQAQPDLLAKPDPAAWKALLPADAPGAAIAPFDAATAKKYQEAWAEYVGEPVEQEIDLGGDVKLTMTLIPPGEFTMGSSAEEQARFLEEAKAGSDKWAIDRILTEGPQHRVRITRAFRLSRYEVTRGQFRQFVDQTGYKTEAEQDGKGGYGYVDGKWIQDPRFVWSADLGFEQTDDHPAVNVSWNDAMAFCQWLSEKEGAEYALPTEAQWEYACRAGTTTAWYCGDSDTGLGDYAWFVANSGGKMHPAGQLKANGWGLYDMHGNVREWCADLWATDYYAQSPPNDPSGSPTGPNRVHRGGNWHSHVRHCRSAFRNHNSPDGRFINLGFRLASVLADKEAEVEPAAGAGPSGAGP